MKRERYLEDAEAVWEHLAGRKIILAGVHSRQKQSFWQNLAHKSGQMGDAFAVSDDLTEANDNDYVFLFGDMECAEDFSVLLECLHVLGQKRIASAALVSDHGVHGKIFGAAHLLETQEIGYACHTCAHDMMITNMRMAEHLAYRMAGEGFPIRIVRAGDAQSGEALEAMMEGAVRVLLWGTVGEVYQLPLLSGRQEQSPLSPMKIAVDASKVEQLRG